MIFGGIDEAGYGPLLGPLSIAAVSAEAADEASLRLGFRKARTGAKDSKQVHVSGDISAIERVALPAIAWLAGSQPANALECFSLMGEAASMHEGIPWMSAAAGLALPIGGGALKAWKIPGVEPRALRGRLIQPREYNASCRAGINKAEIELDAVGALLTAIAPGDQRAMVVVDRLGGRRYYRDALQRLWPDSMVLIEVESPGISGYQVVNAVAEQAISFRVDGESHSPMTAVASCIAKYVRELHMLLLNRHWCAARDGLKATAGYARDAGRWLDELGTAIVEPIRDQLVRGTLADAVAACTDEQAVEAAPGTVPVPSARAAES